MSLSAEQPTYLYSNDEYEEWDNNNHEDNTAAKFDDDGADGVLVSSDSVLLTLVQSYDWAGAIQRIASHPHEAASVGMAQGRTALHVACDHDAPAVVVQALLKAYPDASTMVGTSQMNPLHITCSSQHASVHVVQVLLKEGGLSNSLQSSMRDVDGDTPLHAACRCGAPIEVLEVLLRANPLAVCERDYEGLTPLLRLWVRYFVILGDDVIGAVRGPADLVGELGEAWSKTELLLRVAHHGSLEQLQQEQQQDNTTEAPGTSSSSTRKNVVFRAVHAAAAVDCPRDVVKIATIVHPDQVEERNEEGLLPLMIAATAPIFKVHDLSDDGYLLEDRIHGDDTNNYDNGDNNNNEEQDGTMSSSSSSSTFQPPSVIQILLDASTEVASVPDPAGRLPLHLALASGKNWMQGVKHIMDAYADAVQLQDNKTKLYPFMLAAVGEEESSDCNTIFELLRANPTLVQEGIPVETPQEEETEQEEEPGRELIGG